MDAKERPSATTPTPGGQAPPDRPRGSGPDHDLVVELLKVFATLARTMHAHRQFHHAEAARIAPRIFGSSDLPYRATPAQIQLAIDLSERGEGTISELAGRLGVSASAISLLVDWMVAHGMVERVRRTDDRRVVQVRLSAGAAEMVSTMLRVQRTLLERFVDETPVEERLEFLRHIDRFARTLDTLPEDSPALALPTHPHLAPSVVIRVGD